MSISIDGGIPVPDRARGPKPRFPFAKMQPMESFAVAVETGEDPKKRAECLRVLASQWATRRGSPAKFIVRCRKENDVGLEDEVNGVMRVRVWRAE